MASMEVVPQIHANRTLISGIVTPKRTGRTDLKLFRVKQTAIDAVSLAPMSVNPKYQRQGVGSALVRQGLEFAGIVVSRL
jgi:GNAT superfamily N-acetyltransferase